MPQVAVYQPRKRECESVTSYAIREMNAIYAQILDARDPHKLWRFIVQKLTSYADDTGELSPYALVMYLYMLNHAMAHLKRYPDRVKYRYLLLEFDETADSIRKHFRRMSALDALPSDTSLKLTGNFFTAEEIYLVERGLKSFWEYRPKLHWHCRP